MSLTKRSYYLIILSLALAASGRAQLFTDQGLMSGSGLTILPTATIVPTSEFRVQVSRMGYTRGGGTGVNIFGLTAGLSESLEGYLRVTGEQTGSFLSEVAYGFGGKFRLPLIVPVVRRLALWAEVTSSDQFDRTSLFPSEANRAGVTATFDSNGIHPTIFLGVARMGDRTHALAGAGATIATGNSSQIGIEIIHGYLEKNSAQVALTGSVRVFKNISVHVSPGYMSTSSGSMGTLSMGISLSSADIDFHPRFEIQKGDEFILPSIEDIEKEQQQQPSGSGSMLEESPLNGVPQVGSNDGVPAVKEPLQKNISTQKISATKSLQEEQKAQEKKHE